MPRSRTILCLLIVVCCLTIPTSEENQAADPEKDMMSFRAVKTIAGAEIEMKVGKFVCTAPYFIIKRKPDWKVTPLNGKVQIKRGDTVTTAGQFEISIRH